MLDESSFDIGFPFGTNTNKTVVRPMALGTDVEGVNIEEDYSQEPSIADHGTTIRYATLFGICEYVLPKSQIRNLKIPSVSEISHHESVSVLLRRAVQRGMAIAQLRRYGTVIVKIYVI